MKFTSSVLLAAAPVTLGLGPQGYNVPTNLPDGLYGVILDGQGNPQGGPQMINVNNNNQQINNWNPAQQDNKNKPNNWPGQPWQNGQPGQNGQPWQNGQQGQNGQPWQNGQQGQNGQPWQNGQPGQNGNPWQNGQPGQNGNPWQNGQPGQHGQPWQNGQPGQHGQPGQNGQPWQNGQYHPQGHPDNKHQKHGRSESVKPREFGAFAGRPGITRRDSFPGSVELGCSGRDLEGSGEISAWNNLANWCGDGGHTSQYSIYFTKSQGTVWYSCSKIGPQPCNQKEMTDARERFQHGCSNLKTGHIYIQNWKKTYGRAVPGENICGNNF